MPQQAAFLTGATGALGGWVARQLLCAKMPVIALARDSDAVDAYDRVENTLRTIGQQALAGLQVVNGDILRPHMGFDAHDVGEIDLVVHCAASTAFNESNAEVTRRTNIDGLRNVLEFARTKQSRLVHISTAYVAGKRAGRVYEHELDLGQQFNNAYESSKCEGELLVRRWSVETGLPVTILRPSIVLGDARDGRALRFNTIYDMMRTFDALGSVVRKEPLRIVADKNSTKNLIPVDYFAEVAWRIIQRGVAGTFHICNPRPITFATLREIFIELFGCENTALVSQEEFARQRATAAERACHRAMAVYRPYMTEAEPVFDCSATDALLAGGVEPPAMDVAYFRRILDYARSANWGRKTAVPVAPSPQTDSVTEYFDVFLAGKVGQRLLPDLHRISSHFAIGLQETPREHWAVDVRQGVLHSISTSSDKLECGFRLNVPTFLEVVAGRISPQQAFFNDRIQIEGDVQTGLRLAAVFGQFFRKFPFVPAAAEGRAA